MAMESLTHDRARANKDVFPRPSMRRGCRKLSIFAPEFLYSANNDIGVPSFILSGAPIVSMVYRLSPPTEGLLGNTGVAHDT
jgi:hypothetical protein